MMPSLSMPWRLSLLLSALHVPSIHGIPAQRWNVEAGLPSELNPRAISPIGDGLASAHQRRGLGSGAVIGEWTAMGDSYACGVGVGELIGPMLPSRRYDHSYPELINVDNRLGASNGHKFNNVVCSGSTFKNIQSGGPRSQVDQLGNPAVATLTIGGNNVGFRSILTACIYRFYGGKSGDCATELANSQAIIDSDDFSAGLTLSINDALSKATNPGFRLFVTGYPSFFNEVTEQCNNVNVALWAGFPAYWTKEKRSGINKILKSLNGKISSVVKGINSPKLTYVDVDGLYNTHRFCEETVTEPDFHNDNTWFFHWYTDNRGIGASPWTDCDASSCDSNSDDWGDAFHCQIAKAHAENGTLTLSDGALSSTSGGGSGSISAELARVFHPKSGGQSAYANAIFSSGIQQTSYTPGWCTIHVFQYKKSHPKDKYKWDITIFDASSPPVSIGTLASFEASGGEGFSCNSKLPYAVVLTPGQLDDDACSFSYGGKNWGSDDDKEHHGKFGKYDHGKREGWTGFWC